MRAHIALPSNRALRRKEYIQQETLREDEFGRFHWSHPFLDGHALGHQSVEYTRFRPPSPGPNDVWNVCHGIRSDEAYVETRNIYQRQIDELVNEASGSSE